MGGLPICAVANVRSWQAPRDLSAKGSATDPLDDLAGEPGLDEPAKHPALNLLRRNLSDGSPLSRQEEQRAAMLRSQFSHWL